MLSFGICWKLTFVNPVWLPANKNGCCCINPSFPITHTNICLPQATLAECFLWILFTFITHQQFGRASMFYLIWHKSDSWKWSSVVFLKTEHFQVFVYEIKIETWWPNYWRSISVSSYWGSYPGFSMSLLSDLIWSRRRWRLLWVYIAPL